MKTSYSPEFLQSQKLKLLDLREACENAAKGVSHGTLKEGVESAFGLHQADAGSDTNDRDLALSFLSKEQNAVREINDAIRRIENGSYGICEMSGAVIPQERLEALPFTRYTVECKEKIEKEEGPRKGGWTRKPPVVFTDVEFVESDEDGEILSKPSRSEEEVEEEE